MAAPGQPDPRTGGRQGPRTPGRSTPHIGGRRGPYSRVRPLARGIWVGLVSLGVCLGGVFGGARAIVVIGACVFAGVLVDLAVLHLFAVRPGGRIVRTTTPNPCFAQESVAVQIHLIPHARRGMDWGMLPVHLDDGLPGGGGSIDLATSPSYAVVPSWRGQWWLGPATIRVISPAGCWRRTITDDARTAVIAWPEVAPLDARAGRAPDPEDQLEGRSGPRVARPEDMILRDYAPGDDPRRIHWLRSARLGTLLTRTEETMESRRAWLGLWFAPGSGEAAQEMVISLAASCAVSWREAGYQVSAACGSKALPDDLADQLTALALLDASADHGRLADLRPPLRVNGPAVLLLAAGPGTTGDGTRTDPASGAATWDDLPPARPSALRGALSRLARVGVVVGEDESATGHLQAVGWADLTVAPDADLTDAAGRLGDALAGAAEVDRRLFEAVPS